MTAVHSSISQEEHEQILQTIEMFEVITQANPQDCQSLEILKDAYSRVGKTIEALDAARRLADLYLSLGQLSSAMLEYEGILQKQPNNAEVIAALGEVEQRLVKSGQNLPETPLPSAKFPSAAEQAAAHASGIDLDFKSAVIDHGDPSLIATAQTLHFDQGGAPRPTVKLAPEMESKLADDGNEALSKFLIQHRIAPEETIVAALDRVQKKNRDLRPNSLGASLIEEMCRRGVDLELLLSGILDRSKFAYIPLEYYDVDRSVCKMLPESLTIGRLILPFDIISRTVMVATANPFDALGKQAVQQLLDYNVQWHLAAPQAIARVLSETYRIA